MSGYQIVGSANGIAAGDSEFWYVECPAGLKVLGGGVWNDSDAFGAKVLGSRPISDNQWYVSVANEKNEPAALTAFAMCAKVS